MKYIKHHSFSTRSFFHQKIQAQLLLLPYLLLRRALIFGLVEIKQLSRLLGHESPSMAMGDCIFHIIPENESIELLKFVGAIANTSPCRCPEGILHKTNSFMPQLCDFIQIAIRIKNHFQIVTLTGNMHLVIPEEQRHQWYFI